MALAILTPEERKALLKKGERKKQDLISGCCVMKERDILDALADGGLDCAIHALILCRYWITISGDRDETSHSQAPIQQ